MSNISVTKIAYDDIVRHTAPYTYKAGAYIEVWDVCAIHVFTKRSKALNRLLGIHKLNKSDNIKNIKRIKPWKK